MKCVNPLGVHPEDRPAINRVTIVRTWEDKDLFYLCSSCTAAVQHAATYKNKEIVVEKIISSPQKKS
jgi:hypothetical protein